MFFCTLLGFDFGVMLGYFSGLPYRLASLLIRCSGFVAIENLLKDVAGKYCVGDEITFADILLVPQVYNATRFKINMDDFPMIKRINETLCEVEEFKEAHYSSQPDTPDELRPKTN